MQNNNSNNKPIAIVGMAFRFPGDLATPEQLWQALCSGQDCVTEIPRERWAVNELQHPKRNEAGRSITFSAGVLSRVDEFDAGFFGISPREAAWLDPQHRLLLELSWEAMENAGHAPSGLAGSNTSVYVGISGYDYGVRHTDDMSSMGAHTMTGNTLSVAANRISYVFDLHGPSLAIDTACSSSLVALHHACNSLRNGEADMALAGGVNLLLHPYPFIGFTKASMLSAEGRCKTFDEAGDGYVRAEGGAVLLLKPLDKALADGDPVQAVILATGANADGGRKTGITMPSRQGQAELMRTVVQRAGIAPERIDYIEAHGTGTLVGDPVEANAIGEVYGVNRPVGSELPVASVKTHLGHLEPASGMAGLVKTVLVLQNGMVPSMLHQQHLNSHIDFAGLRLKPATENLPLQRADNEPLIAGVNSFGFGGANAHVLLQQHQPTVDAARSLPVDLPPLFLSARTPTALRDMAAQYAEFLTADNYYDAAYANALRRETMEAQLAVLPVGLDDARQCLQAYATDEPNARVVHEQRVPNAKLAFVYSGNGAQWAGMGRKLLQGLPRFAAFMQQLDTLLLPHTGFSVLQELNDDHLDDTAIAQPLLFAIQVAITQWLAEQGVQPAAVTGHSVGEVAAAWAAGALTLPQAVQVISVRSRYQAQTRGSGRMAALALSAPEALAVLQAEALHGIDIAGYNSPGNITLTGDPLALQRLCAVMEQRGVFCKLLDLDYAFHSPHMDPIRGSVEQALAGLQPAPAGQAEFISTVTGDVLSGIELNAHYWWRNVREPVQFTDACAKLAQLGCTVQVEIGPHAILQRYMKQTLEHTGKTGKITATLLREDDGPQRLQAVALRLHLLCRQDRGIWFPVAGKHLPLPNYPWQRERHWLPDTSDGYRLIERTRVHPLLGWRLKDTDLGWENTIDPFTHPWLADHQVGGAIVLPGAAYAEMALAAAREWLGGQSFEIEDLEIVLPVVFDGEHARNLRLDIQARDGGFVIQGRERLSQDEWIIHASGRICGVAGLAPQSVPALTSATVISAAEHYHLAARLGLDYGPVFQTLAQSRLSHDTLQADLISGELPGGDMLLHPALLDGCFQSLVDFFADDIHAGHGQPLLPVRMGRLCVYKPAQPKRFVTRLLRRGLRSVQAEFYVLDAANQVVAWLGDCRFRAAHLGRAAQHEPAIWQVQPRLAPHPADTLHSQVPPNSTLSQTLDTWFNEAEPSLMRNACYTDLLPLTDALTLAFCHEALRTLETRDAEWLQLALSGGLPSNPSQIWLLWMREILLAENLLAETDQGWQILPSDLPASADIWRTLLAEYPTVLPELSLAGRVGRHLPDLLAGQTDLSLFSQQMLASPSQAALLADSPVYAGVRSAVRELMTHIAGCWPVSQRLRVLEITPTGSELPRVLQQHLSVGQFDCVLAHADESIRAHLLAEHGDAPGVTIAAIQPETGLYADAGLPPLFDIIIVQHTLHMSDDAASLLTLLRGRLAGNGLLLVAERAPDLLADLVQGSQTDWWQSNGPLAPSSRLRHAAAWQSLLAARQFSQIDIWRESANPQAQSGAYLLLARRADVPLVDIPPPVSTLLLIDNQAISRQRAQSVQAGLQQAGQFAELAELALGVDDAAWAKWLSGRQAAGTLPQQLVYCVGYDLHSTTEQILASVSHCAALIHALAQQTTPPALWLASSGGALLEPSPGWANPAAAALWGLARVAMNEYPALTLRLIDCSLEWTDVSCPHELLRELIQPDSESEVVLTAQARHGLRLRKTRAAAPQAGDDRYRLDFLVPGQLRNLTWLPTPITDLAPHQVEVRPMATGLNFRDVMYLMGLLPDEAVEKGFAGASLGLECAGIVSRVGEAVCDFVPGDEVMGFGSACYASHMLTTDIALAHKPVDWTFAAAATVPTVFFTVYYALVHLARLQAGERVLIHGGAGGVGIAAIQLARHLGADVFATAGSQEKRDFVALLGADHVLDSRSLDFAEHILQITDQQGVDVVLNSLAGEAVRRNLRVLKPFGRFLELGKRDFYENTPLGLRPFRDNISYFGIDADQLLVARPALAQQLFNQMMALFHEGDLSPLPHRVFDAHQVIDAFRTMQQAKHIGKLVVNMQTVQPPVSQPVHARLVLSGNGTWLVTGGVAGFGLETARWLTSRGVRHLVLVSRRGMHTPGAAQLLAEFAAQGVQADISACDVADESAVQALLHRIGASMPPLEGIVHAAMVLDDALMAQLTADRYANVLRPKAGGALVLHQLTQHLPLKYFILYSSVTTLIGNAGQANYVAANALLENLAQHRRAQGLPALCVGWGPIDDAGYLTRHQAVKDSLAARLGAAALKTQDALHMLEILLLHDVGVATVADFDWATLARLLPSSNEPRFESLRRHVGQAGQAGNADDFASRIAGKTPDEVQSMVYQLVREQVAQILCSMPDKINPGQPLHDMGLDSLMGVELALALEKSTGVRLPAMLLNEGPTVEKLVARIVEKLQTGEAASAQPSLGELVSQVVAQHGEHLSNEELAQTVQAVAQHITQEGRV